MLLAYRAPVLELAELVRLVLHQVRLALVVWLRLVLVAPVVRLVDLLRLVLVEQLEHLVLAELPGHLELAALHLRLQAMVAVVALLRPALEPDGQLRLMIILIL